MVYVLVDRVQRLVPSHDGGDDAVRIGDPVEGLGVIVGLIDEAVDGGPGGQRRIGRTPRLSRRPHGLAKKPSTALSQKHEVGVKWKAQRGCR